MPKRGDGKRLVPTEETSGGWKLRTKLGPIVVALVGLMDRLMGGTFNGVLEGPIEGPDCGIIGGEHVYNPRPRPIPIQ